MRYMHSSPAGCEEAMRVLPPPGSMLAGAIADHRDPGARSRRAVAPATPLAKWDPSEHFPRAGE